MNKRFFTYTFFLLLLFFLPIGLVQAKELVLENFSLIFQGDQLHVHAIKQLFPYETGQTVSIEEIELRIDNVKKMNFFFAVTHEIKRIDAKHIALEIVVQDAILVRDIKVKGNYPFLSREISRLVISQPGTPFYENSLAQSVDNIKEYLEKNGYYNSEVAISYKLNEKFHQMILYVTIKKGPSYKIREVTVSGVTRFSADKIKNKISTFKRFRTTKFRKDLKRIEEYYRKRGYIRAKASLDKIEFDHERREVDLFISVKEREELILKFFGSSIFSYNQLKKATQLYEKRSYDRYAVKKSADVLKEFFLDNGFPDISVEHSINKEIEGKVIVEYQLKHSQRVQITRLQFKDNRQMAARKLRKQMVSKKATFFTKGYYKEKDVITDRFRLEKFYISKGFLDATLESPEIRSNPFGDQRHIKYFVNEGRKHTIRMIDITSSIPLDKEVVIQKMKIDVTAVVDQEKLTQARIALQEYIFELGYPYATVDFFPLVSKEFSTVKLKVKINAKDKVFVRNVVIRGLHKTKEKIVRKNFILKTNDIFTYNKMIDGQFNLRKLGIFSTVRVVPLGFETQEKQIDILIIAQERKTITADFRLGFDTENSFSGEMDFVKRNLFGTAQQFNLRLIGGEKYDRAEATFLFPRAFGIDWNIANQYFFQYENNRNFNATSFGAYVSILKSFGKRWSFGVKEQITRTNIFESNSNTLLGESIFDNTLNELQTYFTFDLRDNYADPQKGVLIFSSNEFSTEVTNFKNTFNTFELNLVHFQGFLKRFTLVNSIRYSQIFDVGSQAQIPANKLLFLGGGDTIRGFEEDAVNDEGGTLSFLYNAELHFRLFDNIKLAAFFDTGLLINGGWRDVNRSDFRESAGVGLRYFTPIGPIKLDWGFILDRQTDEPNSRLHFSFGYFF